MKRSVSSRLLNIKLELPCEQAFRKTNKTEIKTILQRNDDFADVNLPQCIDKF